MILSIVKNGQTLVPLHEFEGKRVCVKEYSGTRSLDQNAYFHGPVVKYWRDYTGYNDLEMKTLLKYWYAPKVCVTIKRKYGEQTIELPMNTSDMTVKQMSDFIDECVRGAAEHGIEIPPPPYKDSSLPSPSHHDA